MNNSFRQMRERLEETEKKEARIARIEQARREGRIGEFWHEDMPQAQRIKILAAELKQSMDAEERDADPATRELLERARQGDKAAAELAHFKKQQEQQQVEHLARARQEQMAESYGKALAIVKLPKNDITVGLMARAQMDARDEGWELSPEALASETHRLSSEMFDSFAAMEEDEQGNPKNEDELIDLLERFPKFTRRIHQALLAKHKRRQAVTQNAAIAPPPVAPKPQEEAGKPKLVNSIDEAKAYGTRGLRSI